MATLDLGQVVGKSAYQYAVDGGYTGTEQQFRTLMADAATKSYVDGKFSEVAPVIVRVEMLGSHNVILKEYNVKAYPAESAVPSYSINFAMSNNNSDINRLLVYPPQNYAFTGIYRSSGLTLDVTGSDTSAAGDMYNNGAAIEFVLHSLFVGDMTLSGSFELEVA